MPDINRPAICGGPGRDTVYIDTNRILDSCRDKDCFEDTVVYLTSFGQDVIERATDIRTKRARIVATNITVDSVPFNRGFYQVIIKMYVKVECEACIGMGRAQEIEGLCVIEKKVILFGSEGNVNIYKSDPERNGFCSMPDFSGKNSSTNLPTAVLEVVEPIVLNTKIVDSCACRNRCCLNDAELPECICSAFGGPLCYNENGKHLTVSLGIFSVVRIERPAQYLINASEYSVPEKECLFNDEDDPCKLFRHMAFPVEEFNPPSVIPNRNPGTPGCGCDRK